MTRLVTRLVAVVVALVGATTFAAAPAHAADNSLTVVKTAGEQTAAGAPLGGIVFQLNRVLDIDPTTSQGLSDLAQADARLLIDGGSHPLGDDVTITTDAAGVATATALADGVYLVRELPSRIGDVAYTVTTPFLVSLPDLQNGSHAVTVRAKNQQLSIGLDLAPGTVAPGDQVQAVASGTVPAPDVRGRLYHYAIVTRFDPLLIRPAVTGVTIDGPAGPQVLAEGDDYAVRIDGQSVVVELTDRGLATLAALRLGNPGVRVRVAMTAVVATTAAAGQTPGAESWLFTDGWNLPPDLSALSLEAAAVTAGDVSAFAAARATAAVLVVVPPAPPVPPLAGTGSDVGVPAIVSSVLLILAGLVLLRRRTNEERPAPAAGNEDPR